MEEEQRRDSPSSTVGAAGAGAANTATGDNASTPDTTHIGTIATVSVTVAAVVNGLRRRLDGHDESRKAVQEEISTVCHSLREDAAHSRRG